jgi:dTDP-4-amino-4,6-dideoxygalactose transaminase
VDLTCVHEGLVAGVLSDISRLIERGDFVNGEAVARFEERFAAYCRASHCVGVASGLDALRLGLLATGLEPGEEVIVPAMTFVATAEAVTQAGGRPVIADVLEQDWNLDPAAADAAIGPRTRLLLPVHLHGQMADLRALTRLAKRHGLEVAEDACQAHGAERDGMRPGSAARFAAFSFYPAKNLGAFGDAGACVTQDAALAGTVAALREHGQRRKHDHEMEGYTARLDTIQAIVLLHKLERLEEWNGQRRVTAAHYTRELEGVGDLHLPQVPRGSEPVWHLYPVRTREPDALAAHLAEREIATGRHYRRPLHLTQAYQHLGYGRGAFPVAEALADEGLCLPIFPGISERQLEAVVAAVSDYFAARPRS